ncbi:aldose 1-epimerase [Deinococcus sonorensis]|uniref:Aldose 1-epimerase n=2 Tax=Deinococcus sonorensis TaxID=309891 RepID=A0AAU7UDE5_9DEIO
MNTLRIHNEHWRLEVLPELGASVLNLSSASGRPVLRHVDVKDVQTSSQCASFTLMPYSNRIRDARFRFEGREVQLRPSQPGGHTVQHGDVRNRPWRVQPVSGTHLVGLFDSRDCADINWPWAFTARIEYVLHGPHLDMALTLTNVSGEPMPAGMGLHPYFARWQDDTDPTVQFQAGGVYHVDDTLMPTEAAQDVPPELDFSSARSIGPAQLDRVYGSWDGVARLAWGERSVTLTADAAFSHLVLFTAPDGSLAMEPVTHATDAFNLAARGVHGTDMRVLQSGEALSGAVRLTLDGPW